MAIKFLNFFCNFATDVFVRHCLVGFCIRLLFIIYGELHDYYFRVPFTDVDYNVFMDAARHVTQNSSPYERSTYRYTPLIAYILTPCILYHHLFGKVLFSCFDICITVLIKNIISLVNDELPPSKAVKYSLLWLYNPISIIISTRGNSDSIICFLTLITLYFFLKQKYFLCGIFHGLSIHLRLFPITYSLLYYLAIQVESKDSERIRGISKSSSWFNNFLSQFKLNADRVKLVSACTLSLVLVTMFFYWLYGYKFLYETYIYHLVRKDIRHNFSIYFYLLYLISATSDTSFLLKFFMFFPQLLLLLVFSMKLRSVSQVPFCLFCLTFTIVMYNPVLTSQYFVWFLPLLPVCLPNLLMERRKAFILIFLWIFMQLAWLYPAFQLEFKGQNTFIFIWWQSISFFCSNVAVLSNLIKAYRPSNLMQTVKVKTT